MSMVLCVRRLEAQPGQTTEPFSWPRRRNKEAHQLPLVEHAHSDLILFIQARQRLKI